MTGCCKYLSIEGLMPGWGCGVCKTYNGLQRAACKHCEHIRCDALPLFRTPAGCRNCNHGAIPEGALIPLCDTCFKLLDSELEQIDADVALNDSARAQQKKQTLDRYTTWRGYPA